MDSSMHLSRGLLSLVLVLATWAGCSRSSPDQGSDSPTPRSPVTSFSEGLVLEDGGLGLVDFGDAQQDAEAALEDLLGEPTSDSGPGAPNTAFGICPGTSVRLVSWSSLTVFFSNGPTAFRKDGQVHFFQWEQSRGNPDSTTDPLTLSTEGGVGLGSSLDELKAVFGDAVSVSSSPQPSFRIRSDAPGEFGGALSGTAETDTITAFHGGHICAR